MSSIIVCSLLCAHELLTTHREKCSNICSSVQTSHKNWKRTPPPLQSYSRHCWTSSLPPGSQTPNFPQQRLGEASSLTNSNSKIWGAGLTRCDRQLGGYPAEFWLVFVGIVHPNAKHIAERLLSVVWKYIMKLWVNKYIPSLNFGISFWADPTRVSKRELLCWTWAVGCLGGKLQLVH